MKKLIYLCMIAGMLLATACSDDDEYVFSELPSERIEAFRTECETALRGAADGWKFVYYPQKGSYGGFTFLFRFKEKNRVEMTSDFETEVGDYSYNLNLSEGLVLTFDSYSPIHRLANPGYASPVRDGNKGFGLEGDFEFIVKDVGDGVIELIGKKTRVELNMEKATAADWSTVEKLAEMAGYFVLGNAGLGMMVNGELVVGGHVELDDIFHICTMAYKDGEGNTVTVSVPYIITAEGCRFDNDVEVAGVKFNGLEIDLSNGVTNREFVSNDADGAIRFFIMDLSPLDLIPEQVPTFVPNKYIASVDMLKNNDEYIITDMSDGLKAEWEALKEEYPNFVKFTLEMDRKSGYEGSFRVTAVNSADGKEKSHNYDFGTFTLLNNAINQVRFDNSKKSHSTSSGFTDKDLYDKDKNEHVGVIYDAFFSSKGFTVIRDTEEVFWIRSIADPNKWMKLEAD
ncbi:MULTISPECIES: DUF4302 domain-containing protein [Butyricimonas]|uniref:DUF4302 domain-containing protein n=1 Tax=Butyricimonas TaxID=574697 RepID=UPI001D06CB4A|nr:MULTISPECIES: DUF4302 domain-containing protein [Butyricimonas]MCB6971361.1 DUF4302 domain-containing protein [Butyricimonas synergistica]MCG4518075.1 DUF4302 domain-containing protein [Butyricimonas sp. DFI.6.44]